MTTNTDEVGPTPASTGRAHCIPLLHQLSTSHRGDGDVDQPDVAALVLLPLPVSVFVEMKSDGADGRQTAEVETFAPKHVISLQLTGSPRVQTVVQTQLGEVPAV